MFAHLILSHRLHNKPVPGTQMSVELRLVTQRIQSFVRRPIRPRVANKDGGVAHAPSRDVRLDVRQPETLHDACAKTLPVANRRQVKIRAPPAYRHIPLSFYYQYCIQRRKLGEIFGGTGLGTIKKGWHGEGQFTPTPRSLRL